MPFPLRPDVRMAAAALSLGVLPWLAGCAGDDGGGWHKPDVAPAERAADSRACKREADDYALRRTHQPDRLDPTRGSGPGPGRANDPLAEVDRAQARRLHADYYARCMHAKGYVAE